jgi:hypothetical protein
MPLAVRLQDPVVVIVAMFAEPTAQLTVPAHAAESAATAPMDWTVGLLAILVPPLEAFQSMYCAERDVATPAGATAHEVPFPTHQ